MLPFTILSASPESCIIPLFFNLLDTCLIQMIKSLMLHPFLLAFYTTSLHCFSHPRFFTWSASMPRMWSVIVYVHFGSTPIAMYACSLGLLNTPLTHFLSVVGTEISSTILTHFRWSRVFLLCYVVRSSLAISDFFLLEWARYHLPVLLLKFTWTHSFHAFLPGRDRPCIFCKRMIPHDDYDLHYVMCLTRPRVTYNGESSPFVHV